MLPTYQIFFGNDEFCALINIMGSTGTTSIDEAKLNQIFSTIEFEASTTSALEEHANFTISEENSDWKFMAYMANTFSFQNESTETAALIMQLLPESLDISTQKELAIEFMNKIKESVPNIKIIQSGDWRTIHLEGYRLVLEASEDGNTGLLYLFVFGNDKATHVFQGMADSTDETIKETFETFIQGIKFKE